jgi:poly(3-hydroxyalkanoate) synthetase
MFDDWVWNGGLPSQVDKRAFLVGKNLGTTPGAVVFPNEQAELIHYGPKSDQVLVCPLLIVPPQINKFYLFDLAPGRGHIQSVINPPSNAKARYLLNPQLPTDPEVWLAEARGQEGSWWNHWPDWLVARSGQCQPVPTTLGNSRHPPLADAPGTYVFGP